MFLPFLPGEYDGLAVTLSGMSPAPLYLLVVPAVAALFQFSLAGPATEFSRQHAIKNSAELINDIDEYHKANGRYPTSLLAVNKDYKPSVIGIEQFHGSISGLIDSQSGTKN